MFIIKALFYIMFFPIILPFKLIFGCLPKEPDSYETDYDEYAFWRDHGKNY